MANSLLEIKPHKVSRDLRGYSVFFYGEPKSGKTTIASKFPGALLLAFEKGYSALPGVMVKPINSWSEFKKTLRELKDPEVQKIFETVIIDTADIAWSLCEKYVCSQESDDKNDYETIGDIPYGKGYTLVSKEFDEGLRAILQMDYGLVIISHSTDKTFTDERGKEFNQIVPTIDKRARNIVERTCDIIGYARQIETDEGNTTRLFLRETNRFVAGARFKYIADSIEFTYDNLVNAIQEAIDKEAMEHNGTLVTSEAENLSNVKTEYDFDALMKEFQAIVSKLMETQSPTMASKITKIVESHLGKGKKVGDCTPANAAELDLIVYDLKAL